MLALECVSFSLLVCVMLIACVSDIKTGLVRNKFLFPFYVVALVLETVYYAVFARDIVVDFAVNFGIIIIVSLLLYFTHVFGGGDVKLMILLALLYPANYYVVINNQNITLFVTILVSFISGYCYVVGLGLRDIITKKRKVEKKRVFSSFKQFLRCYLISLVYICLVNIINSELLSKVYSLNELILTMVFVFVAWLVNSVKFFSNSYVISLFFVIDLVLSIVLKTIPIPLNWIHWVLVLVLVLLKVLVSTQTYKQTMSNEIKDGMILSTASSVILIGVGVLPINELSHENLKNKLKKEYVQSINVIQPSIQLDVVKKIPFAVFISIGFIAFFLLWGFTKWL